MGHPCTASAAVDRPQGSGELRLTVWRRIDNYPRGLPDHSPLALQLHRRRRRALRAVLGSSDSWAVTDWGTTDSARAHLKVTLRLRPGGPAGQRASAAPSTRALARLLSRHGVSAVAARSAARLIEHLRPPQRAKSILDHEITLPDGTTLWCDPDGEQILITVTLADGRRRHIHCGAPSSQAERPAVELFGQGDPRCKHP